MADIFRTVAPVEIVGEAGDYLEIELGAGGHFLLLSFEGPRRRADAHETLALDVQWHVEAGTSTHRARWVLDASGRSGVVARHDMRIRERDTTTLALVGQWEDTAPDAEDPSLTLVESYKDGWAWSVPTSETTRCVTVMVDPRRTEIRRELGLDGMLRSELAKAHQLSDRLSRGRVIGSTRACAASVYGASKFGQPGLLLVGDAGSAIDPLSSYGVKKAVSYTHLTLPTILLV